MRRRAIITWLLMIPAAIINGAIRQALLEPALGREGAQRVSAMAGSSALIGLAYGMLRKDAARATDRTLLGIGAAWMAATMIFEFGFGHYLLKQPWSELTAAYNLRRGQLWSLVVLAVGAAPMIVKRLMGRQR